MGILSEPLTGVPGLLHHSCIVNAPGRRRVGRKSTRFGIGRIRTPPQLQVCVTLDKFLILSEAPFPQLLKKNTLPGMLDVEHLAQRLACHKHPTEQGLLSLSLQLGKSHLSFALWSPFPPDHRTSSSSEWL